ncbi:DUF1330 domain-containing protein [Pseudomonas sp. DCB_BI]|uniref:DUF1330 domain-containing protein n=1 Tax=Pseudomonas sp. DCB_BI TaxID=2993594 RepID=UPI00224B7A74|nr:DUF1330 domain-containing protein [Pseudomonas sp. DCB_BI]MCX2887296.1 DUF1330 domain-containing protein [Pseudomonas sp. DCB_BI]
MKGYWIIFGGEIVDQAAQAEYGRLWEPIGEKYDAKFKVLNGGGLVEALNTKRVLIVEFASLEQAKACYNDPAYVQAKAFATQASRRELIILEGEL